MDPNLYMPFVKSPIFGYGIGSLSVAPIMFNYTDFKDVVSLEKTQQFIQQYVPNDREKINIPDDVKKSIDNFASHLRIKKIEANFVVFSYGTIIKLNDDIHKTELNNNLFSYIDYYPWHRFKDINFVLKEIYNGHQTIKETNDNDVSTAFMELMECGYPVPGFGADRYIFLLPNYNNNGICDGTYSATWPLSINLSSVFKEHKNDNQELTDMVGREIPIIKDPDIDDLILDHPITLSTISAGFDINVTKQQFYRRHDYDGIERRRLDYCFPHPIAKITKDCSVTYLI